jgi:hypothetical protein
MMRSMLTRSSAALRHRALSVETVKIDAVRGETDPSTEIVDSVLNVTLRNVLHHLVRLSIRSSRDGTIRTIRTIRTVSGVSDVSVHREVSISILISPTTTFRLRMSK